MSLLGVYLIAILPSVDILGTVLAVLSAFALGILYAFHGFEHLCAPPSKIQKILWSIFITGILITVFVPSGDQLQTIVSAYESSKAEIKVEE